MRILMVFVTITLFTISCNTDNREYIFNSENLDGWEIYIEDESVKPEEFFYVNDGMMETTGVPLGYIRTEKEFKNYRLHVEWRYPEKPTNSGVFMHVTGPDLIWVGHYQGQLKHENAGDFIVHGVGRSATLNDTVYTSTEEKKPLIPKMQPGNENPAGQWNSYDITCKADTIELRVNGLLQNMATNCSVTKGGIGFQAEGSKIQFRNLWVESLE